MSFIDDLVNISIAADATTASQAGFGTPLIAAFHTHWNDRVRAYGGLSELVTDGFRANELAYKLAAVMFAQSPRPATVKVGRRALGFTQVFVLTPNAPVDGSAAETYGAAIDGLSARFTSDGTPTVAEVCTGLAAAVNALGDVDAILATGGSTGGVQTLSGASLDGAIGRAVMNPPRPLTMTFSSSADWDATTATVTGTDVAGATITETFAIPNNGAVTRTGVKLFRTVTSVAIPAQSGTGGTFTVGVRAPVTADGTSGTHVTCTAPVAGELHSVELLTNNPGSLTNLQLSDTTVDPGIATDLAAIQLADADWYGLTLDSNSAAEISAAAVWVEASQKLFTAQTADTACEDGTSTTDLAAVLQAAGYTRTALCFAPTIGANFLAAGALGERLPSQPGSDTWAYKSPAAVSTYALTSTQRNALLAKNVNVFTVVGGKRLTFPGVTSSGLFVDITRFVDWLHARMQERLFGFLTGAEKRPYTDATVDLLKAEILAQLDAGITVGGLKSDPKPTVFAPKVASVSDGDRAARRLPGVTFNAGLAGAIHTLSVSGTVRA